ncbi:nucleoside 2-deoxyribosyltransferase [Sphingomonas sp. 3-13AW]|uniref:nucleoside 2-deoxyribosyltransferase n=1 Tax=Sphingomonas sp. 3-13AW TaxID=3050450 RepID=UPI003BB5A873
MALRLYLAGPDVFLPDAPAVARHKLDLCASLGFEGIFPFDVEASPSAIGSFEDGVAIYRGNLGRMRAADAIVANLTPFRGVGADAGTAFELGFFAALDRPIYGYSSAGDDFATRMRALVGDDRDAVVEDFGHHDNLMLGGAVASHGKWVTVADGDPAARAAFEACLRAIPRNS